MRIYINELPGAFCTVEPDPMRIRRVELGVYHGYTETDDGRRIALPPLDLKPQGVPRQVR